MNVESPEKLIVGDGKIILKGILRKSVVRNSEQGNAQGPIRRQALVSAVLRLRIPPVSYTNRNSKMYAVHCADGKISNRTDD
jgi:hypothetical protein